MNSFSGTLFVDQVELPSGMSGEKVFRGSVGVDSGQSLLTNGSNPNGMRVALSNANFLGVTALDASDAETAQHGFEMRLPLADLPPVDPGCQRVRVMAMLVAADGTVASQVLPPVDVTAPDLGIAPGFGFIPGQQYASFALTGPWDMDSDGDVDVLDFGAFASLFGQAVDPGSKGDTDGNGVVNILDFGEFAARFGCGG